MKAQVKQLPQVKLAVDFAAKQQATTDEGHRDAPVKPAAQPPKMEKKGV